MKSSQTPFVPQYYEFHCPVKILSGLKALSNLPYELSLLGASRPLLVSDRGVVDAGLLAKVQASFQGTEAACGAVFDGTPPDSSVEIVDDVASVYRERGCDAVVAVGGGSCIDTAKCALMVLAEGVSDLKPLQGAERMTMARPPFVVVPTTAGTGSEVTGVAVVKDVTAHAKMAFMSFRLLPDVAILDPEMTLTMPPRITAATGIDALTHAIEAWYSLQKNPVSDAFSAAAIRLIMANLVTCVESGGDPQARLAMANAALLAGIAFSNSMVGVIHAVAHALGGVCGVPHGVANAILLPWGMEHNLGKAAASLAELAPLLGASGAATAEDQARNAIQTVRNLTARLHDCCGLPITLEQAGVARDRLESIARATIDDGSVTFNPEEVGYRDALAILEKAWG